MSSRQYNVVMAGLTAAVVSPIGRRLQDTAAIRAGGRSDERNSDELQLFKYIGGFAEGVFYKGVVMIRIVAKIFLVLGLTVFLWVSPFGTEYPRVVNGVVFIAIYFVSMYFISKYL